jgi:hypothetical protein
MIENERRRSKSLEFCEYSENNPVPLLEFLGMIGDRHLTNQFKVVLNPLQDRPLHSLRSAGSKDAFGMFEADLRLFDEWSILHGLACVCDIVFYGSGQGVRWRDQLQA